MRLVFSPFETGVICISDDIDEVFEIIKGFEEGVQG